MAMAFPITPVLDGTFLGKAFVICVLGGLGSVPGALIGGLVLGLLESFGAVTLGSQWSATVGFVIMLALLGSIITVFLNYYSTAMAVFL